MGVTSDYLKVDGEILAWNLGAAGQIIYLRGYLKEPVPEDTKDYLLKSDEVK